jgi:hypothetical protein
MIKIHHYMQLQVQGCWADSMILGMNKIGVVLLIHNPNMNQIVPICDKMNLRWEIKARDNKEGKKS